MAKVMWDVDYNATVYVEGLGIDIYKRIPFEKKDAFAREYAASVLVLENNGLAEENMYYKQIMQFMLVKYYTNAEINESMKISDITEWFVANKLEEIIFEACGSDVEETLELAQNCVRIAKKTWEQRHSLESLASGMFDDEIQKTIAENKEINDEMLKLLHGRNIENTNSNNKEKKVAYLKGFAKKDL